MRLRLATYNIHACVGADGRFDPPRTAAVLRELGADLVALQEVEHHAVGDQDLLDYLAGAVGMTPIAGPTLLRGTRDYGNALLSRLPVLALDRVDLSLPRREPRGALNLELDWVGRRIQVVATHLGLRPGERRRQVRRLLALFEPGRADAAVLLGDLNEWLLWGRPLRWLRRRFPGVRRSPATYPARMPLLALDRIWVHPPGALTRIETHDSELSRLASDHLPLTAELSHRGLRAAEGSRPNGDDGLVHT
jgi:endonuclease/exonuclease/phosphatase family metal-dependent hydrolase